MLYRHRFGGQFAVLLGLLSNNAARADQIFVANFNNNRIGEYTTAGNPVNASLISGLSGPIGIAVSGSDLFVAGAVGTIGEYTSAGAPVNADLISGLDNPVRLLV